MNYSRKRKKTKKEATVRIRSLLYLLDKILGLLKEIEQQNEHRLEMPKRYYQRIRTKKLF